MFHATVYAAKEAATMEDVVDYRFMKVQFGRGAFGGESRCCCRGESLPCWGLRHDTSHRDTLKLQSAEVVSLNF